MRYNTLQLLAYASLAGSSLVMPLFAHQLGAGTATIGLIGAAYGFASFLSNTIFGRAGDRFDRRLLLLGGFLTSAVACILQFFATTPTMFLWTRFLFGFTMGMIPPTLAAYVYDVKRPLGKFTAYNAWGWLVAASLVVCIGYLQTHLLSNPRLESIRETFLSDAGTYGAVFVLGSLGCLAAFLFALQLRPMRLGLKIQLFPKEIIQANLHVYLSIFVRHFGAAAIWVIYPLYIVALGGDLTLIGWVYIINMIGQILVYPNIERIPRIGNPRWLIGIGLLLSAITFYSFTLAHNAVQLLPLQFPLGISFACLWLGCMKEIMEHNVARATATGLLNASMNLSNVAGPLAGGAIAAAYGFHATMYFATLLTVAAFVLFLLLGRDHAQPLEATTLVTTGATGEISP